MSAAADYWDTPAALGHIAPGEWPEGEDFGEWLVEKVTRGRRGYVLDFGCGVGRLAPFFDAADYIGFDRSPQMRNAFEAAHPTRVYSYAIGYSRHGAVLARPGRLWPQLSAAFAHTVLLHVPDDEIDDVVRRLADLAPRVLVSEIMGRAWRRPGDPPVFNREVADYCTLFERHGMRLNQLWTRPYNRYGPATKLTVLEFVNQTVSSFRQPGHVHAWVGR